MAHRYGSSRGGSLGCLILVSLPIRFTVLGELLAQPVLMPALLAAQQPPQHTTPAQLAMLIAISYGVALLVDRHAGRSRRVPLWALLLRAGGLAALCSLAAVLAGDLLVPRIFGQQDPGWAGAATVQSLVVGVVAWVWSRSVRAWARTAAVAATSVHAPDQPAPGEVWLAMVPYRERAEEGRRHCVVLRTCDDHAEVVQITTRNKDDRADHIRMSPKGWSRTGKPCWVEAGAPPRKVRYENFLARQAQGRCPAGTWRQIKKRQAALAAARPPESRPKPAGNTAGGNTAGNASPTAERNTEWHAARAGRKTARSTAQATPPPPPPRRPEQVIKVPVQRGPARWLSRLGARRRG
ncbi:hypothetical protein [Kitasatospora sp. NPDC050543]|uniref:hypothetical protein n=1 Tax=Kitasatospora sp. NPDC050543 TaxID=3364054 RepID=UPI003799A6A8